MSCSRPTMTEEHFSNLLPSHWKNQVIETTRFCISPRGKKAEIRYAGSFVMVGGLECCLSLGLREVVGVVYPNNVKVFKRMGWGPEVMKQDEKYVLGHWTVQERYLEGLRDRMPEHQVTITTRALQKLREWKNAADHSEP